MLKDITIGQFIPGESVVHRLDPRTKILGVILYMIGLFALDRLEAFVAVAILTLLIVWLSRIPLNYLLKGLKPVLIILLFTVGLHFFLTPGTVIWRLGPLKVTIEGIKQGIFMSLRLIFLVLVTSLLTLTTSPINLTDGLEKLLGPGKKIGLPAHELAMMMSIALRFIPTLLEETEKIMKAQIARGADFESGNLWQRAKSMVPLLVPLFVSAFRRADELALAMEARCYRGSIGRTKMKQLKMTGRDYFAIAILSVFVGWAFIYRFFF
ncbi:MAG: energy-coupling factor transporter transmembrane component T family protein [Zhaonellaceae bacterium]|jgi:energy-coupling factor transport system permease protein|nr:energy-coupling factor transporter transmembrane protein EcfT [Clostridia bacterium]